MEIGDKKSEINYDDNDNEDKNSIY